MFLSSDSISNANPWWELTDIDVAKICKIWIFGNFLKFVTLTSTSFDLGSDVNHLYG